MAIVLILAYDVGNNCKAGESCIDITTLSGARKGFSLSHRHNEVMVHGMHPGLLLLSGF